LICTWGKLSVVDEQQVKMDKVNQLYENQTRMVKKLNEIVKEDAQVSMTELKKKYKKDWNANRLKI
jgi:hypothetical protein